MAERIDHAAEAVTPMRRVSGARMTDGEATVSLMGAQVHATLALVEQQRIANLIALAGLPALAGFENETYDARLEALMAGLLDRREAPAVPGYGPAGIDEHTFIRPEIAEALGIPTDD